MKTKSLAVILGSALLAVSSVMAQQDIVSFSSPGILANDGDWTLGYEFQVTSPITVTGLSAFANGPYSTAVTGLDENTAVGLWNSSDALIASATVLAGTAAPLTLDGLFRYASITPMTLPDGTYYVGAEMGDNLYTFYTSGFASIPGVTFVQDQAVPGSSLAFPDRSFGITASAGGGFFGGNVVIGGVSAVPDASSTLALLSGACLTLGLLRRKLA